MNFEEKVTTVMGRTDKKDMALAATGALSYLECLAEVPDDQLRTKINHDFSVWLEVFKRTAGYDWNDVRETS